MYHLTQSKGGISSIELGRRLGVTQTTAWKIKHKLMQAMMERGHPPAVERRHHRPPFNWCKAKQICATLCLHRDSPAFETNRSRNTIFSDPGPRCTHPFEKSGLGR